MTDTKSYQSLCSQSTYAAHAGNRYRRLTKDILLFLSKKSDVSAEEGSILIIHSPTSNLTRIVPHLFVICHAAYYVSYHNMVVTAPQV